MNIIRVTSYILLLASVLASGCSCSATKPTPDPLAGWQIDFKTDPSPAVQKDYQDYIQKLSPEDRYTATVDGWLKDDTGQHAVKIRTGTHGPDWEHILIYDKDDKRIKVIKYMSGHSYS
jgi:hypothetical protein